MRKAPTLLLKAVLLLTGIIVLAICSLFLPRAILAELSGDFDYGPILVGLYVAAVPFLFALFQAYKLLTYIDKDKVFSQPSIQTLKLIKYCAITITALFSLGMPYVFYVADRDDAPGLAAIGFIIVGVSFVIYAAAGLFQKLLQGAVDIKSENDLTV